MLGQGEAAGWLVWYGVLLTPERLDLIPPYPGSPLDFMESMLSHGKGAAFFPHVSQGVLGAHQQLHIDITGCANMWGEYWDNLVCTVRACGGRGLQGVQGP